MTVKIKVYSDYICPFCYLAKHPFEEAIKGKDVEVEWVPFELRPEPYPKLDPVNDSSKLALWDKYIYPTMKSLNIDMKLPNISPHPYTGLAFEGFHFAKEKGLEKEYNNRIFKAFFQEEMNIGEINVLVALAKEIGLDENEFKETLTNRVYKHIQEKALDYAYNEAHIHAVPTFFIGDTMVTGMNSTEEFENVINQQLNEKKSISIEGMNCNINNKCS